MHPRHPALLALVAALSAGSTASPAAAAPPVEYAGTYTVSQFTVTDFEALSESVNRFSAMSVTAPTGAVTGPTTSTLRCLQVEDVTLTCRGSTHFVGTLAGAAVEAHGRTHFVCHYETATTGTCKGSTRATNTTGGRELTRYDLDLATNRGAYTVRVLG
jgi:hypothetical protein